jgi:hypothetical protein
MTVVVKDGRSFEGPLGLRFVQCFGSGTAQGW